MITSTDARGDRSRTIPTAAAQILTRVAKHLALLACLGLIGVASGRGVAPTVIFFLVVVAAVVHSAGRALASSELRLARRSRHGP